MWKTEKKKMELNSPSFLGANSHGVKVCPGKIFVSLTQTRVI